jgi:hypothetical protein
MRYEKTAFQLRWAILRAPRNGRVSHSQTDMDCDFTRRLRFLRARQRPICLHEDASMHSAGGRGTQQKRMIGDLQDIGGRSASCINDSLLHRHLLSACWDRYIGTTRKTQRRCCLSGRADMLRPTYGEQRLLQRGESHRRTLPARVPRVRLHRYPFR